MLSYVHNLSRSWFPVTQAVRMKLAPCTVQEALHVFARCHKRLRYCLPVHSKPVFPGVYQCSIRQSQDECLFRALRVFAGFPCTMS